MNDLCYDNLMTKICFRWRIQKARNKFSVVSVTYRNAVKKCLKLKMKLHKVLIFIGFQEGELHPLLLICQIFRSHLSCWNKRGILVTKVSQEIFVWINFFYKKHSPHYASILSTLHIFMCLWHLFFSYILITIQ